MSPAHVSSVNVGSAVRSAAASASAPSGTTGIDKQPVDRLQVRAPGADKGASGVVGDHIGDTKHHGGDTQAVYLVAQEELRVWGEQLGRVLRPGTFGENLTTAGIDLDALPLGTRLRVGQEVVLRVSGPRIPCATFAGHMGERGWVRRFTERGRPGAYCAVERPGTIVARDRIEVLERPGHGVDLMLAFRALMGEPAAAERVLAARVLPEREHDKLAAAMARRAGPPDTVEGA